MLSGTRTTDSRGVAPVIGVTLLIGITVILAATVAAFAFGFDDTASQGQVPAVALSTDYDARGSDELAFSHESGEVVEVQNLYLTIDGASCSDPADPNGNHDAEHFVTTSDFSSGRTITVDEGGIQASRGGTSCDDLDLSSATVRLSWRTGSGTSTTVGTWNGPA